ncbi:helix-turn-helix transcriptional regulator [Streptomyces sp. NBC_01571]|uniref:helix-turn-helix domain-containing protein n=1 Tax=Streptomyces sp. NBC_01571 TaxID=2975883 RepID=UPI0022537DE9|nr:helix-turn-helix transcriptional regulator [Streptomyces sp. NBC_01571]MCX4578150.1 helix-turn-helix transcriptional regulator [Streptomyces sp. NBC_01571]
MANYRLRSGLLLETASAQGDRSCYAIAKRTGISESTLSRLRRGVAKPASETLLVLSQAYGLSIDDLIEHSAAVGPEVQSGSAAGNDEATRGPAGSPQSSKSAPTHK